jgi:hypothetical protein
MEFISFIKGLQKKGKIYQDVWMSILFRLEEKDTIDLNRRLDLSKSQYYRIISFGMKLWNEKIPSTPIELNYGKLSILKTETIKQVKPKAEKKTKNEPKIIEAEINMEEVYESIIYYLNQKAGTGYKSQTTSYRSFINARLKAGKCPNFSVSANTPSQSKMMPYSTVILLFQNFQIIAYTLLSLQQLILQHLQIILMDPIYLSSQIFSILLMN